MINKEFISQMDDEMVYLLKQFSRYNPIGSLLMNDRYEIININDTLVEYFDDDVDKTKLFFGNIFKCQYISNPESLCGNMRQCANCKIRNSLKTAIEFDRVIKNVHIHKVFSTNEEKKMKWFDMTIVPMTLNKRKYLWVSLNNLTELMKYKIEFEMSKIIDDEASIVEKDEFHKRVMSELITLNHATNKVALILIELNHIDEIMNNFGMLWRNDYIASFNHFLRDKLGEKDDICIYQRNQFLIYSPDKEIQAIKSFLEEINAYHYKFFDHINNLTSRTLILKKSLNQTSDEGDDRIHVEYFKVLSLLEQLEENTLYEQDFNMTQ